MKKVEEEIEGRDEGTHKSFEDSKEKVEDATISLNIEWVVELLSLKLHFSF